MAHVEEHGCAEEIEHCTGEEGCAESESCEDYRCNGGTGELGSLLGNSSRHACIHEPFSSYEVGDHRLPSWGLDGVTDPDECGECEKLDQVELMQEREEKSSGAARGVDELTRRRHTSTIASVCDAPC
jgi:hypothetical protein